MEKRELTDSLISSSHPKWKTASMSSAVFNLSTTMVGAGIMSMPAAMKILGIIPGFLMLLFITYLVETTADFMLKFTQIANDGRSCTTYTALVDDSFGRLGAISLQICAIVTQFGCLVIYLIILGDVMSGTDKGTKHLGLLQEWFGEECWWSLRPFALAFIVVFIILPFLLLRRMDSLRYSSAVSILLAVLFVGLTIGKAIASMLQGKTHKVRLFPDFDDTKMSVFNLFTTIPIFVTGLGFHLNLHRIGAELGKPSDMGNAVRTSLLICVSIYFAIGFSGYLLFGELIMPDMLVNFDDQETKILNDVVRLSYAIHLVLVFPVINFNVRANIEEVIFSSTNPEKNTRFVILTCLLLAFTYLLAVTLPNIWYFFQFIGSTTNVITMFIFPSAVVLRDVHNISSTKDIIKAIVVIFFAVGTSSIAIYANLYN